MKQPERKIRCAIYTRKSTEEGLEQEFNSLDAQRESAEAYITSQKAEGWVCLPDKYDDGGFTGGNMERPALKRLLADITAGKIDCVVVYKVDRLSRSLMDFARMVEVFEKHHVSFVSVTQQFNTTHSMGRLTLNILLSFAQFEREIISERTRDKIAAARKRGQWSGGAPILGYDRVREVTGSRLIVNKDEAERVRQIFVMYLETGSLIQTTRQLNRLRWTNKIWTTTKGKTRGGKAFDKCSLYNLLINPLYMGKVRHKEHLYAGKHQAIVDEDVFRKVHDTLVRNRNCGSQAHKKNTNALLKGLVRCKACGCAMTPSYATNKGKRYRYYVCLKAQKQGWSSCPGPSLPAGELEKFVVDQIRTIGKDPRLIADVIQATKARLAAAGSHAAVDNDELVGALESFDPLWDRLSPRERMRLIQLMVRQVEYDAATEEISIAFNPTGINQCANQEVAA